MSPREFLTRQSASADLMEAREGWVRPILETLRWIGGLIYNVNVKPSSRKPPERLLRFSFDKPAAPARPNGEVPPNELAQIKAAAERAERRMREIKHKA